MDLINKNGKTYTTVFASKIKVDRLITIPLTTRKYFKSEHNLELKPGQNIRIKIKNGKNESERFPRKITAGYRVRIPKEIIEFYNFIVGGSVEVEIEIKTMLIENQTVLNFTKKKPKLGSWWGNIDGKKRY